MVKFNEKTKNIKTNKYNKIRVYFQRVGRLTVEAVQLVLKTLTNVKKTDTHAP